MKARLVSIAVTALAVAGLAALGGAQQASAAQVGNAHVGDNPTSDQFALATPVHDGLERPAASRQSLQSSTSSSGGMYTTPSGNQIAMYASSWYRPDSQWLQNWANWLDTNLPHGSEFSRLSVYFVPEKSSYYEDLESMCGPGAAGCYFPDTQRLIAPGNNLSDGTQMASILAHEYGHHIANNRSNAPWDASAWGPKRWASDMNICRRVAAGTAFPGDEGAHYTLNPGEAWAETYRQMVWSSKAWTSWPAAPWAVVDQSFYPTAITLSDAWQDALYPYSAPYAGTTFTGRLTKQHRTVTVTVSTRYDGDLSVELFSPFGAHLTMVNGDSGAIIATATSSFSHPICGERSLRIRISGPVGKRYRFVVHTP